MIFVGGIHGAGKSYFCDIMSKKYNIPTFSASTLISESKKEQFAKNKHIADINGNQNYFIEAIYKIKTQYKNFLLDGHFCLLNSTGEIHRIPFNTFEQLAPIAIIVVSDEVETIVERLNSRDGVKHDKYKINSFQKEELLYSSEVSQKLHIPYLNFENSNDIDKACQFLEIFLAK